MEKTLKSLQSEVNKQVFINAELQQENALLKEMILQLKNRKFGTSADRLDVPNQMTLFNEAEAVLSSSLMLMSLLRFPLKPTSAAVGASSPKH